MATKYVFEEVSIGDDLYLYVDGNSKITAGNGTYEDPKPNAFSLPHISTCPCSTKQCREACYVYGLQKHAPEVYAKYCQNERVVNKILLDDNIEYAEKFGEWISKNCEHGFRWHVSGDVMSKSYAFWITNVCNASTNVLHWIYTRSLPVVDILNYAENLVVNISADSENYSYVKLFLNSATFKVNADGSCIRETPIRNNRVCYSTRDGIIPDDLPENSVIFPDYSLRGRDLENPTEHSWWQGLSSENRKKVCPGDFFGQSEKHRCGVCKKCL